MLLLTTQNLPVGYVIEEAYSLVLANKTIQISDKGLIQNLFGKPRNEYNEALDFLASLAPEGANAIIGIQISTATQHFENGTFLYLTMIGTPVRLSNSH